MRMRDARHACEPCAAKCVLPMRGAEALHFNDAGARRSGGELQPRLKWVRLPPASFPPVKLVPAIRHRQQLGERQFEAGQERRAVDLPFAHDLLFGNLQCAAANRQGAPESVKNPVFPDAELAVFMHLLDVVPVQSRFDSDTHSATIVGTSLCGSGRRPSPAQMTRSARRRLVRVSTVCSAFDFQGRRRHDQSPVDELVPIQWVGLLNSIEFLRCERNPSQTRTQHDTWRRSDAHRDPPSRTKLIIFNVRQSPAAVSPVARAPTRGIDAGPAIHRRPGGPPARTAARRRASPAERSHSLPPADIRRARPTAER
jgi:hypothetical protein